MSSQGVHDLTSPQTVGQHNRQYVVGSVTDSMEFSIQRPPLSKLNVLNKTFNGRFVESKHGKATLLEDEQATFKVFTL